MSSRSWVTSSLARRPEIFCWVFSGRTPRSLMLFVGQTLVFPVKRSTSSRCPLQNSSSSRPGFCFVLFLGPGTRGTLASPARTACRNWCSSGLSASAGIAERSLFTGGVPGMDHAAQRPLRLHRPDSIRVALGAVLIVPQYVSETRLVPGHVLPPGIEVVLVAVGDHDPGGPRQDPGVLHRVQAAGTQPERRVQLGERAVDVLLLPGRPGPQRGLVEAGHGRCGA